VKILTRPVNKSETGTTKETIPYDLCKINNRYKEGEEFGATSNSSLEEDKKNFLRIK